MTYAAMVQFRSSCRRYRFREDAMEGILGRQPHNRHARAGDGGLGKHSQSPGRPGEAVRVYLVSAVCAVCTAAVLVLRAQLHCQDIDRDRHRNRLQSPADGARMGQSAPRKLAPDLERARHRSVLCRARLYAAAHCRWLYRQRCRDQGDPGAFPLGQIRVVHRAAAAGPGHS